jgi:hypothetical protein
MLAMVVTVVVVTVIVAVMKVIRTGFVIDLMGGGIGYN